MSFIFGVGKVERRRGSRATAIARIADLQRAERDRADAPLRRAKAAPVRGWRAASTTRTVERRARNQERLGGDDIRPATSPISARSSASSGACPRRSRRGSRQKELAGATVTLKLKTADFKLRTRARSLGHRRSSPAQIFAAARDLLSAKPTAPTSA